MYLVSCITSLSPSFYQPYQRDFRLGRTYKVITSTSCPHDIPLVRSIFLIFCCQIPDAEAKFERQMASQLPRIPVGHSRSSVIIAPITVALPLEIVNSTFSIKPNKMPCQPVALLTIAQPATSFHSSRKKLITEIVFTVEPPRAFVFSI